MTCDKGDFAEYAELRRSLSEREGDLSGARASSRRAEAARSLSLLRPGDIIRVPGGRRAGLRRLVLQPWPALCSQGPAGRGPRRRWQRPGPALARATGGRLTAASPRPAGGRADNGSAVTEFAGPGPLVLTEGRQVKRLAVADFPVPAEVVGKIRIPGSFSPRSPQHRRDLAATMRNRLESATRGDDPPEPPDHGGVPPPRTPLAPLAPLRGATPTPPPVTSRICGGGFGVIRAMTARTARTMPGTPNVTCAWPARPRRSSAGWPGGRT